MLRARDAERRAARAERMAEIGAMTGGLAHEIKNPLSTIGLNVQLVTEGLADLAVEDPAERDRLLRRVESLGREVERLRQVLTEFLEFAGALHLEPAPTDLNELTEGLADFFMAQARSAGVRLDVALDPTAPVAMLDANHVKQATLNLLINATQAMARSPENTPKRLIMRTSVVAPDDDEAGHAELWVEDSGPGIAADAVERVFTPYFTTKPGGSGLGLPLARRIVEAHGGSIDIVSSTGGDGEPSGTRIVMRFPLPA